MNSVSVIIDDAAGLSSVRTREPDAHLLGNAGLGRLERLDHHFALPAVSREDLFYLLTKSHALSQRQRQKEIKSLAYCAESGGYCKSIEKPPGRSSSGFSGDHF